MPNSLVKIEAMSLGRGDTDTLEFKLLIHFCKEKSEKDGIVHNQLSHNEHNK
jgi:hypothetical protein